MKPSAGDRVRVILDDEEVEGMLMPNEETDAIVVKLDNGYNIGISPKRIKGTKVIEKPKSR